MVRRLLRSVPLPLFALALGLLVGGLAWLVVERTQSTALSAIFDNALEEQLHRSARDVLLRFDNHRRSFEFLARLLANHRRMGAYLEPILWSQHSSSKTEYKATHPPWLPQGRIWRDLATPSHLILVDPAGGIREVYSLAGEPLPRQLTEEPGVYLAASSERAFLTTLDGHPYLVVSEPVADSNYYPMGSLAILVAMDSAFLAASQQSVQATQSVAAIMDPDAQHILSSSDPQSIEAGTSVDDLRDDYLVTAQSFFEYDDSDLNMLFATLVPRAAFLATSRSVMELERRQRAIGVAGIVAVFVLMFVLVSARINGVLLRLQDFARKALGEKLPGAQVFSGNRLLMLEDRIREVIDLVLRAREETRSRHETEVQHVEGLRAAVMEASVDSIVTIDEAGKIIDFNHTAQSILGRTLEQVQGQELPELMFDGESAERFRRLLDQCLRAPGSEESTLHHELTAFDADDRLFVAEVSIKPVKLKQELLFTVYLRNIAEQKAREAEMRALAAFPEESPIPMLRVNARGVIIYANAPSFALLTYWECRPMQTLPFYWRQQVERVLRTGDDLETEIVTEDGQYSLLLTPVQGLGYVNIYARDVTAQRRAEDALQQRQAELVHVARLSTMGEMSTGIAHELNQPLSAIVNFSNGIARRLRLDIGGKEELLSALSQISDQANRAAEIIKHLRSLVTKRQTNRSRTDLNHLVREVCDLLAHDLRKQQVNMERHLHPEELPIRVDAVQIEQALINLMRNAMDSMRERSATQRRLYIESGVRGAGYAFVSVRDNGDGIKPADMEQLFDAFFTTKETGMGMGLAITQTIVENHRGRIYADSRPGKGSTFTIELPISIESVESLAS